jgi:hypothetical protein
VLAALPVRSAHAAPVEPLGASGRWITDAEARVIGVDHAAIEPTPDGYDTAFLQALAAEAEAVGRSGLFVLADVHQDMDDRLLGGPGDDRLKGGPGRDRLKRGKGRDLALAGRGDSVHASCEKVRGGKK